MLGIDIEICAVCGLALRIIACIEDPMVIKAILAQLAGKAVLAVAAAATGPGASACFFQRLNW